MLRYLTLSFFLIASHFLHAGVKFLSIADIHYGAQNTSGKGNDTGDALWASALTKYKELGSQANFILLLGDIPTHSINNIEEKNEYEAKVFHDLFTANSEHKPIFYVAGNNDSLAGNYQPFSQNGLSPLSNAKDWNGACANCDGLLIDDSNMYEKGYYSTYVVQNNQDIVLIVLNATQFVKMPPWLPNSYPDQDKDANSQLVWLEQQLTQSKSKQLLIAMHEEPGVDYINKPVWENDYLQRFIVLLNNAQPFHQQISLLTAHSHYDELRKITLEDKATIYSYSTPSISRSHNNNSAMKMFYLTDNFQMQDFITYFTSDDLHWTNRHYHAIHGVKKQIFSQCEGRYLADCLNSLTNDELCEIMDKEHIYGVKNPELSYANCLASYTIN